ncbi:hypothetical protein LACPH_002263 [Lacticaseibacillus parahuelsenbergensis]|uniref:Uncharacterized protein n=1 Tax=Lacticaseibacillus parahuelsenbergensis TaxID=3068305 RepID=A0ABY9L4R5_9LACO|nr:hypothetical protein [Lacticaseibacillus sp. NCIMB 15471]WLV77510.1 hypothetical protein LACPH_002263 [Lacticaseibacillus sp. NCIMB 15471]
MKSMLIGIVLVGASSLALASSNTRVSAEQNNPNSDTSNWSASQVTNWLNSSQDKQADAPATPDTSGIVALDPYVQVVNNQFKLSIPSGVKVDPTEVKAAEEAIAATNKDISQNEGTIDVNTKEVNIPQVETRAAEYWERRQYWWGNRLIFRSNAQVNTFVHLLRNGGNGLGAIHIPYIDVFSVITNHWRDIANAIESFNNSHQNDKIYIDLHNSWADNWVIGVWHD